MVLARSEREPASNREDAEEPAGFEPGVHAGGRSVRAAVRAGHSSDSSALTQQAVRGYPISTWTPACAAAVSRIGSSSVRRGAIGPVPGSGCGGRCGWPSGHSTPSELGQPVASTASSNFHRRSRNASPPGPATDRDRHLRHRPGRLRRAARRRRRHPGRSGRRDQGRRLRRGDHRHRPRMVLVRSIIEETSPPSGNRVSRYDMADVAPPTCAGSSPTWPASTDCG